VRGILAAIEKKIQYRNAVNELTPELRIFGVTSVSKPGQFNATLLEYVFFDIILGIRA
jgi:hypothetical protein